MALELLVILGLVLLNGLFAGAEIAIVALRGSRLRQLATAGSHRARAVQRLRENPERFLATVQIGITVIGAAAGAFGGARFGRDLEPFIRRAPYVGAWSEELSLALVVAVVSYLSLVLGELCPKSLALRSSERYALLVARPLLGLARVVRPFVWLLTASSNTVLRLFGDRTSFVEARLSPEELSQLVDEAAEGGTVDRAAGEIASRALELADLTAVEVMVPRPRVGALPRTASAEEVRRVFLEHGHTRVPVYEGTIDRIVGYVTVKDVIALSWESGLVILEDTIRPAYVVRDWTRATEMLAEMRRRRTQLAIVADERGDTSGIVTLEDLMEQLVGDILSERDGEEPPAISQAPDGSSLVDGEVTVREVNRELGIDLPQGDGYATLAGLCNALAGRIPREGDTFTVGGTRLVVAKASPKRVLAVRVHPAPAGEPPDERS